MPLLILLGIGAVFGIANLKESCEKPAPPLDGKALDNMASEMIGKSKSECRKILKKYRGRF